MTKTVYDYLNYQFTTINHFDSIAFCLIEVQSLNSKALT